MLQHMGILVDLVFLLNQKFPEKYIEITNKLIILDYFLQNTDYSVSRKASMLVDAAKYYHTRDRLNDEIYFEQLDYYDEIYEHNSKDLYLLADLMYKVYNNHDMTDNDIALFTILNTKYNDNRDVRYSVHAFPYADVGSRLYRTLRDVNIKSKIFVFTKSNPNELYKMTLRTKANNIIVDVLHTRWGLVAEDFGAYNDFDLPFPIDAIEPFLLNKKELELWSI